MPHQASTPSRWMAHFSSVKQESFRVRKTFRTTSVLAWGYCIMRVMRFKAVVLDFFEAREPFTTRYRPRKRQKAP